MKLKEESEKVGVKLHIQKTKIMTSGPIISWQTDGKTVTLFLGAPKSLQMLISAMKLKHLLLGRTVMTNLDSILKSRDITLPTKIRFVKAMVFPVVMYGCESWTIKKAERQRIDTFELWCWKRLWPPDAKNWLIRKDPDSGKDWRQEEKGMTEDEMVGWHHRLHGDEFE